MTGSTPMTHGWMLLCFFSTLPRSLDFSLLLLLHGLIRRIQCLGNPFRFFLV